MNDIMEDFAKLGKYEKFEIIEQLWDSMDADENAPPMSDSMFQELERRALWSAQNTGQGQTISRIAADVGVVL